MWILSRTLCNGKQECVAYNGHFGKNCFHPLFCFSSDGDCLGAKLRPGNIHSADGALDFITRFVERYRPWFNLWLRGYAAFATPEIYEYCEDNISSQHTGRPSPVKTAPTIIWRRSGRWALE